MPSIPSRSFSFNTGPNLRAALTVDQVGLVRVFDGPDAVGAAGFVAVAVDHDSIISGTCETQDEAVQRVSDLVTGLHPVPEMPTGQGTVNQMRAARRWTEMARLRDGGVSLRQIDAALAAGPHGVEWWIASRTVRDLIRQHGLIRLHRCEQAPGTPLSFSSRSPRD